MRATLVSALLIAVSAHPGLAGDRRECGLRAAEAPAVKASLRANASFRPRHSAPLCPRATRQFTPSCGDITAMLTQ
jgi:hypothetical protein